MSVRWRSESVFVAERTWRCVSEVITAASGVGSGVGWLVSIVA
jgi:hypothetical protein